MLQTEIFLQVAHVCLSVVGILRLFVSVPESLPDHMPGSAVRL